MSESLNQMAAAIAAISNLKDEIKNYLTRIQKKGMHLNASPGARSTAPATTSALASPKCCACHARWGCPCHANASPGARSTAPATISALASPKCCECYARWGPTAARATTPQPFRQLPNAAPATQTQAQVHEVLRLPRLQHLHLQSAAPATQDGSPQPRAPQHLPNAAPATQTQAQVHEVLRLPRFQHLPLQSAAPATRDGGPQPRARQHPSPLNSSQMLPLPRKRKPCVSECV